MKKIIWIPLVIIALGVVLALVGCAAGGLQGFWIDRAGIHLANAERGKLIKVDESFDSFKDIKVDAAFLDRVDLKEGDGYAVRGQNYERWGGLDVALKGDTLTVIANDNDRWHLDFGIDSLFHDNRKDAWLEITYPAGTALGDVDMMLSAGNVQIDSLECKAFTVDDNFGNVDVSAVKCDSLLITADAGSVELVDADVAGSAVINSHFGDVELSSLRAGSLSADLNSGKMTVEDAAARVFDVKNDFGKIEIDGAESDNMTLKLNSGDLSADGIKTGDLTVKSSFGKVELDRLEFTGLCEVRNNSGDVNLGLSMAEHDLSYSLNTSAGDVWVQGAKSSGSVTNRNSDATADLQVNADFGAIRLEFAG